MTSEEFLTMPLVDLQALTGVTSPRWSRYFSGQALSERTISRIATRLEIPPGELLSAINKRREAYHSK
jgi:Cro/C1-type HTH DNA-binding domain